MEFFASQFIFHVAALCHEQLTVGVHLYWLFVGVALAISLASESSIGRRLRGFPRACRAMPGPTMNSPRFCSALYKAYHFLPLFVDELNALVAVVKLILFGGLKEPGRRRGQLDEVPGVQAAVLPRSLGIHHLGVRARSGKQDLKGAWITEPGSRP